MAEKITDWWILVSEVEVLLGASEVSISGRKNEVPTLGPCLGRVKLK